jgi:tetratricopeptide (TPR) repeat protein
MRQLSHPAGGSGPSSAVDQIRLFRRDPELRWRYRVHEQILPVIREQGHEVRWTEIILSHRGYQTAELRERKRVRNQRLLEAELADRPDDPFTLFNLGWLHLQAGQAELALALLERCRQRLSPEISITRKLYALQAGCYRGLKRPREALAACAAGLRLFPDDVELWFLQGLVAREAGLYAGAEVAMRQALSIKPGQFFGMADPDLQGYKAWHEMALICRAVRRDAEAEAWWRKVVAAQPGCQPAWHGLGYLYLDRGRWSDLETAARHLGPVEGALLRSKGYLARGEFVAARVAAEEALAHEPHSFRGQL